MIIKPRTKSPELQILTSLNNRMELSEKYQSRFFTLQKGYEGEVLFESYVGKLQNNYLILNDLFLQINSTYFQLDSLMITTDKIFLFEAKNYEGDYFYDSIKDRISYKSKEVVSPHFQVEKSETLLRQLLQSHGIQLPIESTVIFVNPEFMLYNAPFDKPYIYPTQIHRFLKQFNNNSTNRPNKYHFVSDILLSTHTSDSQFWQIPRYEFGDLKKGIVCAVCSSFMSSVEGQSCVCMKCSHSEPVSIAVMRSVEEFRLLFPEERITTNVIFDWCKGITSRRTILRILFSNFKMVGKYRAAYFE